MHEFIADEERETLQKVLSVVVPFYNTKSALFEKCMASLESTPDEDIEVIIVDDGSDEKSKAYLKTRTARSNLDVRVISKQNGGQNSARSAGAKAASGEYLLFHDSDDYVDTYGLKEVIAYLKTSKPDILTFNYDYVDMVGNVLTAISNWNRGFSSVGIKEAIIKSDSLCMQCYKRESVAYILADLVQDIHIGEDLASTLVVLLSLNNPSIVSYGGTVYHYVQNPLSTLHRPLPEWNTDILKAFDFVLEQAHERAIAEIDEIEWMAILHVLRWGGERVVCSGKSVNRTKKVFFDWMNSTFPDWRNNPYLSICSETKSIPFRLLVGGHWQAFGLLDKFVRSFSKVLGRL